MGERGLCGRVAINRARVVLRVKWENRIMPVVVLKRAPVKMVFVMCIDFGSDTLGLPGYKS